MASHASSSRDPVVRVTPSTDEMLDREESEDESEEEEAGQGITDADLQGLRKTARSQAKQLAQMMEVLTVLTTQLAARAEPSTEHRPTKPKVSPPEKYSGERAELKPFLTAIDLHCA